MLGSWFLFQATIAPLHMLPTFLEHMPSPNQLHASVWAMPGPTMAWLHLWGFSLTFAIPTAFMWASAGECPRSYRRTALDDLGRRMVPISMAIGGVMCVRVYRPAVFRR